MGRPDGEWSPGVARLEHSPRRGVDPIVRGASRPGQFPDLPREVLGDRPPSPSLAHHREGRDLLDLLETQKRDANRFPRADRPGLEATPEPIGRDFGIEVEGVETGRIDGAGGVGPDRGDDRMVQGERLSLLRPGIGGTDVHPQTPIGTGQGAGNFEIQDELFPDLPTGERSPPVIDPRLEKVGEPTIVRLKATVQFTGNTLEARPDGRIQPAQKSAGALEDRTTLLFGDLLDLTGQLAEAHLERPLVRRGGQDPPDLRLEIDRSNHRSENLVTGPHRPVEEAELLLEKLVDPTFRLVVKIDHVDHQDVVLLPVAMATADPLLDPLRIPRQIVVEDLVAELEVEPLRPRLRRDQDLRAGLELVNQGPAHGQ